MYWGLRNNLPANTIVDPKGGVSVHVGVPFGVKGWWDGQFRTVFTMWETDELPVRFIKWIQPFDRILVPCFQNRELFAQHHSDVVAVPLGVDHSVWSPGPDPDGPFRFAAGGSLWRRKGLDLVVEAFNLLKLPNTELHIKAAPHALDVPKQKLGANIFLHRQWMTLPDHVEWTRQAHCFVAPARGEGWGLMPLQAIAAGIPTIISDTSGQNEFRDVATIVLPTVKRPSETVGCWEEVSVKELAAAMRAVHDNWHDHRAVALKNVTKSKKYSWEKAAKRLVLALPKLEPVDTDIWVQPNVEWRVRCLRPVKADINNKRWVMTPGEEYVVPEGVFQVLYDSKAVEDI
jgi:glycosyltransferase involved in cell wall biosynthesis